MTLADLLRRRSAEQPELPIYRFLDADGSVARSLSFAELDSAARGVAAALREKTEPGERAVLLYPPGLDFAIGFWACQYAGLAAVPVHPPRGRQKLGRLLAVLRDADCRLVLGESATLDGFAERLRSLDAPEGALFVATDRIPGAGGSEDAHAAGGSGGDLAFLQYTSGSTGDPKGVRVSHANLLANLRDMDRGWSHGPESVLVTWLPVYHDMGLVYGTLQPVFSSIPCLAMAPVSFLQRPLRWLEAISSWRATHSGGPNFAYQACVEAALEARQEGALDLDLSSWRMAINGAEPVRHETLRRFAETFAPCGFESRTFCPGFGMAESTLKATASAVGEEPTVLWVEAAALAAGRAVEAAEGSGERGQALVGCGWTHDEATEIRIVDAESLSPLGDGQVGEIWLAGPSVAGGYWRRPEESARAFEAKLEGDSTQPEGSRRTRHLRTGDLGFVREGELFVTGRIKELIVLRGRNLYPQDLERTVQASHPALQSDSGAAFALETERGEESFAVVQEVRREGWRSLDTESIFEAIVESIAVEHEARPEAVVLLRPADLGKTSSGKIQRALARERFLDGSLRALAEWRPAAVEPAPAPETRQETQGGTDAPSAGSASLGSESDSLSLWLGGELGLGRGERPPLDRPFSLFGLDSAAAVRLSGRLSDHLGLDLSAHLLFDYPTPRQLLRRLEELRRPGESSEEPAAAGRVDRGSGEEIALVGMALRVPSADDPESFFRLMVDGVDPLTAGPLGASSLAPRRLRAPGRWVAAGLLQEVDRFDAEAFGIAPREAERMDPQQRLLVETAWRALEDAGVPPSSLAGSRTGVFVGVSGRDYERLRAGDGGDAYLGTGNAASIAANRLSYLFDLRGPSLSVDTACSSSLVAVHLAVRSLRLAECDLALVAGVNLLLDSEVTSSLDQAGMMSPTGRCRTFDAGADGYVRGEGCGVVVLARRDDAERLGLAARSLLLGSAINQDGRSNGLTAPNGPAQTAVVREALADARADARDVAYVETHGTGTPLGDPIEVEALRRALGPSEGRERVLGALKSQIGHLEAAAGILGLIKASLVLERRQIPANLHFEKLNPAIALGDGFRVADRLLPLEPTGERPRDLAGVSSFGFGGTNAHVILAQAAPGDPERRREPQDAEAPPSAIGLLPLSAATAETLERSLPSWIEHAERCGWRPQAARLAFSRREALPHRAVLVEPRSEEGASGPRIVRGRAPSEGSGRGLAFLFSGQGSQWPGMGRGLYRAEEVFRRSFDRCCEAFDGLLPSPLREVVFAAPGETSPLSRTLFTQPALFALQVSLLELWRSWGVRPGGVLGHSIGGVTAAYAAGALEWDDAVRLVAARAEAMDSVTAQGRMVALRRGEAEVLPAIEKRAEAVALAAVNAPGRVVVSGDPEAVTELLEELGIAGDLEPDVQELDVSQAFHSPLMEGAAERLEAAVQDLEFTEPTLDWISDLTGSPLTREALRDSAGAPAPGSEPPWAGYWSSHLRSTVRFADGVASLHDLGYRALVEIGPRPGLLAAARLSWPAPSQAEGDAPADPPAVWVPSLRPPRDDRQQMAESFAALHCAGVEVDWRSYLDSGEGGGALEARLPTTRFAGRRYWLPAGEEARASAAPPLYRIAWRRSPWPEGLPSAADSEKAPTVWLCRSGERNAALEGALRDVLEKAGARVEGLDPQDLTGGAAAAGRTALEPNGREPKILWLADPDLPRPENDWADLLVARGRELAAALGVCARVGRLWVATRGAVPVLPNAAPAREEDPVEPAAAGLWGLARCAAQEAHGAWGGVIDLPADLTTPQALQDAAEGLARHLLGAAPDGEEAAALRGGERWVPRLRPAAAEAGARIPATPQECLITGGLGSVGLEIAGWLAESGCQKLLLIGRRQPDEAAAEAIERLHRRTGAVLETRSVDVSDADAVGRLIEDRPELDGVVHAAGVLEEAPLEDLASAARLEELIAAKVRGAVHLHRALGDRPLRAFILCASIAGVWGSKNQAAYAAANAFLDALAWRRRQAGLAATAVDWGPWAGSG
ncbi:MAG: SDR family NAD(P)-dependent oxidoreductase, partial [Acidobacteriota bacterium]